jgi:hypothetical protein
MDAINFLKQLRPSGPWLLTAIAPDSKTKTKPPTKTCRTEAEVMAFIRLHDGERNLYYSVNPTHGRR